MTLLTITVVEAICDHPDIKAISFVGSTPVARIVSARAQTNHKRVVALGGAKNHLVAAPDCNVSVTSRDIVNSYSGCAGERCMAASVLLTIGEQQSLVDQIVELTNEIRPGNKSGEMGPVIDTASLEKIERYLEGIDDSEDAKILVDGRTWKGRLGTNVNGYWIGPSVILHKNKDDPAMKVPPFQFTLIIGRNFRSNFINLRSLIKRGSHRYSKLLSIRQRSSNLHYFRPRSRMVHRAIHSGHDRCKHRNSRSARTVFIWRNK